MSFSTYSDLVVRDRKNRIDLIECVSACLYCGRVTRYEKANREYMSMCDRTL